MKEIFQNIQEYAASTKTLVIEAAHIYADQHPGQEQQAGAILASEVLYTLNKPSHKTLLIDDIHVASPTLDYGFYRQWLAEQGYLVDEVTMESTLIPGAHQLLGKIREAVPPKKLAVAKREIWQPKGSVGLWTGEGKVPLLVDSGEPSCALLDATFYVKKAQMGEVCITILPKQYAEQQLHTLALLKKVRPDIIAISILFDPNNFWGDVTIAFNRRVGS